MWDLIFYLLFGWITFFRLVFLAIFGYGFYLFWTKQDADLTLLFLERYGKPLSAFRGKVVWITGASSGIGEALAYKLAENRAKLILSGTRQDALNEVKQKCIERGLMDEEVLTLAFDIRETHLHQQFFLQALDHFKKLDILVSNAGRSQRANFEDVDLDIDRELFDINVFGLVNLTRIVLRYFYENNIKGQLVATSSSAGIFGFPFSCTYTASKHAIIGYYECLRTECYLRGVRVTVLCPGPVFSQIVARAFTAKKGEVFGEQGKHPPNAKRMATDRCAHLSAVAIINQVDHAWMTLQPVLLMHYMAQYTPTIFRRVIGLYMTPERARKVREGN